MNFPALKNDRLIRAAKGEDVDKIPVWIMRQAGRHLPEFRELRSKYDFFTICQTPTLAAEVTLQPIERYDLDAAIIFSDILVIPQALGMTVEMNPGPVFPEPLVGPEDIVKLKTPVNVNSSLGYVFEAITLTRHKLNGKVPLIGFSGAPWTLMSYMIEGGSPEKMGKAKEWLEKYPEDSEKLLNILSEVVINYLIGQVTAGAQALQLFESNAEHLDRELFIKFALPSIVKIGKDVQTTLKSLNFDIPMVIFAKGASYALKEVSESGYSVLGLDWTVDPSEVRKLVGNSVTLQGNLDPQILKSSKEDIRNNVKEMVEKFGKKRYIANLGHGIDKDADPEKVEVFIETVHSF